MGKDKEDLDIFYKKTGILLALDFREESNLRGYLVINSGTSLPKSAINISLPFHSTKSNSPQEGFFRVGEYKTWTLVTFENGQAVWPQHIDFVPDIESTPEAYNSSDVGSKTIYFESIGLLRRIRYRYQDNSASNPLQDIPKDLDLGQPDALQILIPDGSQEIAVKDGELTIPPRLVTQARVFPASSPNPDIHFLEIAYQVAETDSQKIIVKWGAKTLLALAPLIGLVLVSREHIRRPRLRLILIITGSVLFLSILATIFWAAWTAPDGGDAIGDTILLLVSAIVGGLIFIVRTKDD